jgi:hypothetical protein
MSRSDMTERALCRCKRQCSGMIPGKCACPFLTWLPTGSDTDGELESRYAVAIRV